MTHVTDRSPRGAGRLRLAALALLTLALACACVPGGGMARAEPAPHAGLLWNHSGQPAVFPLLVKTRAGRDYYLQLSAPGGGKPVLAAYIHGGQFFRVLVPHGDFILRFASGPGPWQGEGRLFGPGTRWLALPAPLSFAVRGIGQKMGHIVDLRGASSGAEVLAGARDQAICQRLMLDPDSLRLGPEYRAPAPGLKPVPYFTAPQLDVHRYICG